MRIATANFYLKIFKYLDLKRKNISTFVKNTNSCMKGSKNTKHMTTRVPDNLIESYIVTTARRKIGIYGERFIDVLTQATVQQEKGICSNGILEIKEESDKSFYVTFSISRVMANTMDRNYDDAEEALRCLEKIFFEYKTNDVWKSRALITDPMIDKVKHVATFRVPYDIWEALESREYGHRKFNPSVAYMTGSDYAYRLYKLISGQRVPLRYRVSEVRHMLDCVNKYPRLSDFREKIIDASAEDLKKCADWYFTYDMESSKEAKLSTKRGRPALDIIVFYPKENFYIQRDAVMTTGGNPIEILPSKLRNHLNHKLDFTDQEIKNSRVIIPAYEIMKADLLNLLLDNTGRIDSSREKKSYTINLIKHYVFETYGVVLGAPKEKDTGGKDGNTPEEVSGTLF